MKLKPMFDRVILKFEEPEEKTKSGIVLTSSAQEKPQFATVVAVGSGEEADGKKTTMISKVGDRVVCSKYAGDTVKIDGEEYTIVQQSESIATVEE